MKHAILIAALMGLVGCSGNVSTGNAFVVIYEDTENGCQYLRAAHGGITPRLSPDGTQICKETDDDH